MSLKRIQLIGNVVADATITKPTSGSKSVINFIVAHNELYTDKQGQKQQKTAFFECAYWKDHDHTNIANYIKKGSKVYVEGEPEIKMFKRKDGEISAVIRINVKNIDTNNVSEKKPAAPATDKVKDDMPY